MLSTTSTCGKQINGKTAFNSIQRPSSTNKQDLCSLLFDRNTLTIGVLAIIYDHQVVVLYRIFEIVNIANDQITLENSAIQLFVVAIDNLDLYGAQVFVQKVQVDSVARFS